MKGISLSNLVKLTKAELVGPNDVGPKDVGPKEELKAAELSAQIIDLLTDTRHLRQAQGCVFFALKTAHNDGHRYIKDAYDQGIRYFVVQELPKDIEAFPSAVFLLVKSPIKSLQLLAQSHRECFDIPVVGITGSNGKTIVKEWLSYLLEGDKSIVKSPKSYNSQIGVPLSVWEMNQDNEIGIFEAGISEPGEMENLEKIIQPTIGIFTGIGAAHEANFIDISQKIGEKLKLFIHTKSLIFSAEHFLIKEKILSSSIFKNIKLNTWSLDSNVIADLTVYNKESGHAEDDIFFTKLYATYKDSKVNIQIPFIDQASIENAMHCWLFMLEQGYDPELIKTRMSKLQAVEMRMEMKEGINRNFIINDSYSFDFDSLVIAVDFLSNRASHQKKRIVLSDILQSGCNEDELYENIAQLLRDYKIDYMVGIGERISHYAPHFKGIETLFYKTTEAFLKSFNSDLWFNEAILLKGARIFAFEKISARLQQKVHQTVLEINLNAMIHNLNFFRSKLKPETKLMIMGKAFSYGSGSYEIAHSMSFHRSDYITVAYVDEGVALREKGVEMPIMVLNAEEEGMENVLRYKIEPEIYSFRMLDIFCRNLDLYSSSYANSTVFIHIKLDTGMHRLGFEEKDIAELIKKLLLHPNIRVKSIFTHLATADDPTMDLYTKSQLDKFERLSSEIKKSLPYGEEILRHVLNTAGICRFPEYQYDMVRLGIGLYGVGVTEEMSGKLETVSTWKTTISQIRDIPKGDAVGYGRKFIAEAPIKIGVIGVGYADGFSRLLGNGNAKVWINGKLAPTIGNVCMDMCMINLSDIEAKEGDEVIIFGSQWPISNMAEALNTIPYEVLTSISSRVKRVYYQE